MQNIQTIDDPKAEPSVELTSYLCTDRYWVEKLSLPGCPRNLCKLPWQAGRQLDCAGCLYCIALFTAALFKLYSAGGLLCTMCAQSSIANQIHIRKQSNPGGPDWEREFQHLGKLSNLQGHPLPSMARGKLKEQSNG